ncbi:geminin-like [Argiope bruennichi]|uniref:geminin-like n=1 Tax=Argiope bruennichi TaxID=94029 RepID=UPI002493D722|nr:geminin-like [Argiope bruennichi]
MSRLLMSESPALTKLRNNKSKRVLQVLQVSATDKDLLVSPNLMSGNGKKPAESRKKTEVYEDGLLSKENTPVVPTVRRSKRKNMVSQEQVKKMTSKEGTETKESSNKVSKVTKPKKTSSRKNKKQSTVDSKQSKMDSFIATCSTSNTIFESNLEFVGSPVDNDMQLQQSKNSVEVTISTSSALTSAASLQDSKDLGNAISPSMLTSDNPPDSYWKMLAEERRIALEQALCENEQLYDQIQVLETENSQLKSCLKEAEKLAEVLRQALD